MKSRLAPALALAVLLVPSVLRAQKVTTEFDESVDFTRLKTFVLQGGEVYSSSPALDSALVDKRIRGAITARLAKKGIREVPANGDFVVTYSLGALNRRAVEARPPGWRPRRVRHDTVRYTQGTLVIDVQDLRNNLLWRAVCVDIESNAGKIARDLTKNVDKTLESFPPVKK
jgi:hypothetical protein